MKRRFQFRLIHFFQLLTLAALAGAAFVSFRTEGSITYNVESFPEFDFALREWIDRECQFADSSVIRVESGSGLSLQLDFSSSGTKPNLPTDIPWEELGYDKVSVHSVRYSSGISGLGWWPVIAALFTYVGLSTWDKRQQSRDKANLQKEK